jgi:hypothetical protein
VWSSSPDFVTGQRFDGPDKGGVVQLAMAKPGAGVEKLLRLRGRWQSHLQAACRIQRVIQVSRCP